MRRRARDVASATIDDVVDDVAPATTFAAANATFAPSDAGASAIDTWYMHAFRENPVALPKADTMA